MRFRELVRRINEEQGPLQTPDNPLQQLQPQVPQNPIKTVKNQVVPPDQQMGQEPSKVKTKRAFKGDGPFVFDGVTYATRKDQEPEVNAIGNILRDEFPLVKVNNEVENLNDDKKIPSIRILNALPRESVLTVLANAGYKLTNTQNEIQKVSGTYRNFIYTFTKNNIVFTVVIAGKGAKGADGINSEGGCQVGIQMLRPEKFGLLGVEKTKTELATIVKAAIPKVAKSDPILQQALSQLIDVAMGQRSTVDAPLMSHISGCLNLISQDFGEILTPIVLADGKNDIISFSATSNKPLIDVDVKGVPVAVKSLGGSGNSFSAIRDMIHDYEKSMKEEDPNWTPNKTFKILQDFVSKDGKTNDKLIRAAQLAAVPEATTLNSILGTVPQNYAQMEAAVSKLIQGLSATPEGRQNLYAAYLNTIWPASISANRTRGKQKPSALGEKPKPPAPVGLPGDYRYYIGGGTKTEKQSDKSAGKKKFDANFVRAASRQLTYMLGMGFRNQVVDGDDKNEMEQTITNVMTRKDAIAAKITINNDGSIKVIKTPFKDLKFGYQYHAGTDTVDQNAPGFHIQFV
jgi:hypothetical protein